ncbi:MAG: FAD:protein FMN transferase [Endomicrobiales bacterium]
MKKLLGILLFVVIVGGTLLGIRLHNQWKYHTEKQTRFMMDTYVTIEAGGPARTARKAVSAALDRMEEINVKMNPHNPESLLYAFNHKGTPLDDPEIVALVEQGLEVSRVSDGAFDMTLLPLTELWGFNTPSPRLPADNDIKKALARTGYQYLVVRDGKVQKLRPCITLDFGGIGKGYAVGEALKVLKKEGITSAVINAGGNVYALGKRGGDRVWKVGIKDPRTDGVMGYLELQDLCIACSGDYERFFIQDGKRYHHVFDRHTGYPAQGGLTSASIIYSDCALTDAWTKVLFVLGPEKGLALVKQVPGMEAIMVTPSGEILSTYGPQSLKQVETAGPAK